MNKIREEFERALREEIERVFQERIAKIENDEKIALKRIEQKSSEKLKVLTDKRRETLKSIPKFWLHAFTAHPVLVNLLNSKDREIFDEYLSSIEVEDNQDVSTGYSITFNFNDNPYFDNQSIAKSLIFDGGELKEVKATTIQWKEGKSMPNEVGPKKDDQLVQEESSCYALSFFHWFHELKIPDQVADIIRNQLWTTPLKYIMETCWDEDEEDCQVDGDNDEED